MASKNNTKQKEKLYQDLESCLERLNSSLDSLKESVDAIQVGDGEVSYWNGTNAYSVIKTTLTQYEMNKTLLDYINECKESAKNR